MKAALRIILVLGWVSLWGWMCYQGIWPWIGFLPVAAVCLPALFVQPVYQKDIIWPPEQERFNDEDEKEPWQYENLVMTRDELEEYHSQRDPV
jgi:hypothetical protein